MEKNMKKQQKKIAKITKKKVKQKSKLLNTTANWIDIERVEIDRILLKGGIMVGGIKIIPPDILLESTATQISWVKKLQYALGRIKFALYHQYIYTPVSLTEEIEVDETLLSKEEDAARRELLEADIETEIGIEKTMGELSFFIMFQAKNDKKFYEKLNELSRAFADFEHKKMNIIDFGNVIKDEFGNTNINDLIFSTGEWGILNDDPEVRGDKVFKLNESANYRVQKQKLAPYSFKRRDRELIISDKFVRTFLVTKLPPRIGFGLLSSYLQGSDIKIRIMTNTLKYDLTKPLKNDLKQKEKQYEKASDPTLKKKLEKAIEELEEHVNEAVYDNAKSLDMFMTLTVENYSLEDLNDDCAKLKSEFAQEELLIQDISLVQQNLYKLTSPLFVSSGLNKDLMWNFGLPITTRNYATMWPYNFITLKDKYGFLLGFEKNNGGVIRFDPNIYNTQLDIARASNRLNGNITIFGASGFGKSTLINKFVRYFIRMHRHLVWIDPDNKNYNMIRKFGGDFVHWGVPGNIINIFDLKAITNDDEDEVIDEKMVYDTKIAIANVISDFKQIMTYLHPDIKEKVAYSLTEIGDIIYKVYENKGIKEDISFKYLKVTDYPILSDLVKVIEEEIELSEGVKKDKLVDLRSFINIMIVDNAHFFDGHTTVDLSNEIIGYGTKALKEQPLGVRTALNHIMFKQAWSICSSMTDSAFVVDEGQEYVLEGDSAKEVSTASRRSRKYNNIFVYGSQEANDLASDVMINGVALSTHGKAIINNSAYKFIMGLEKGAIESLTKLIELNDTEKDFLISTGGKIKMGDALFIGGSKRIPIQIFASDRELHEMDPARNKLL